MEDSEKKKIQDLQRAALNPDDESLDRKKIDLQSVVDDYVARPAQSALDPATIPVEEYNHVSFINVDGGWTQQRVNEWQQKIFGLSPRYLLAEEGVMSKLEEEVGELEKALEEFIVHPTPENLQALAKELADVQIVNYQIAGTLGINVQEHVDRAMEKNLRRKWSVNENGSGRHVAE